jgi:hypothetical protein
MNCWLNTAWEANLQLQFVQKVVKEIYDWLGIFHDVGNSPIKLCFIAGTFSIYM